MRKKVSNPAVSRKRYYKKIQCTVFGLNLADDKELDQHVNARHVIDIRKECYYCGEMFHNNTHLRNHRMKQHNSQTRVPNEKRFHQKGNQDKYTGARDQGNF